MKLLPKPLSAQRRHGVVRRRREGRRCGRRGHRRRHHPGRHGDDGPGGDARGRAVRPRGLRPRRRGDPARASPTARPRKSPTRSTRMKEVLERQRRDAARGLARSEAERLRFWAGRKAAFPAVGRISPDYYCMDGTIPRKRLGEVLQAIAAMEKKYGLRCAERLPRRRRQPAPADPVRRQRCRTRLVRAEQFGAEILELSIARRRHRHRRARRRRREDRPDVRAVRQRDSCRPFTRSSAPSIQPGCSTRARRCRRSHRCAEYGRMHVHGGQLKFPELPRF